MNLLMTIILAFMTFYMPLEASQPFEEQCEFEVNLNDYMRLEKFAGERRYTERKYAILISVEGVISGDASCQSYVGDSKLLEISPADYRRIKDQDKLKFEYKHEVTYYPNGKVYGYTEWKPL